MRADRASAAQPTVEVAATGRRRPRAICHTEQTSERQNVQASAECVRPTWSRWRPCVLAAPAGRGARVRDSGRASRRHARPRAPSCTATASHAVPPIPPVAAPAEGLGRTSQRAWLLQQNYAHDAVTAQWSAAASPASPGAILLVEHAPTVAKACDVSGSESKQQSKRAAVARRGLANSIEAVCRCSMRTFSGSITVISARQIGHTRPTR